MRFVLDIDVDGPAFAADRRMEVGRILINAMTQVMRGTDKTVGVLKDSRGADVGAYGFYVNSR